MSKLKYAITALVAAALSAGTAGFITPSQAATQDPGKVAAIGGTYVPAGLWCHEDHVIAFVQSGPKPYGLGCVHPDHLYR
jgi:hypothetical protein